MTQHFRLTVVSSLRIKKTLSSLVYFSAALAPEELRYRILCISGGPVTFLHHTGLLVNRATRRGKSFTLLIDRQHVLYEKVSQHCSFSFCHSNSLGTQKSITKINQKGANAQKLWPTAASPTQKSLSYFCDKGQLFPTVWDWWFQNSAHVSRTSLSCTQKKVQSCPWWALSPNSLEHSYYSWCQRLSGKKLMGIGCQPSSTYVFISSGKISRNSFESWDTTALEDFQVENKMYSIQVDVTIVSQKTEIF